MVVQHNLTAMNSNRQLGITTALQAKSSEKLSSGFKINRAADDAAGLTISEKMRSQVRGLNRASTNDPNTSEDRGAIAAELKQLTIEIDRIQSTTQFNTQNLLDGTFGGDDNKKFLQVGALEGQNIEISIKNMNAETIGLTGGDADGAGALAGITEAEIGSEELVESIKDNESAGKVMTSIKVAIKAVSEQRSDLGALQNRLEHTVLNLDNISENTQAAESRIRDTNVPKEMVEFSKNNILAQAGQAMLAQANQSTQGVLSLLR